MTCRCCGKPVPPFDAHPIHTRCIPKHWAKHGQGLNASRCREFGHLSEATRTREAALEDAQRRD